MKTLTLVALAFSLLACPGTSPSPTPVPGTNYCAAAEQTLLRLQCKDSRGLLLGGPNKHGVSYTDRCTTAQNNGVPMAPQCVSNITNCNQVDTCLQDQ